MHGTVVPERPFNFQAAAGVLRRRAEHRRAANRHRRTEALDDREKIVAMIIADFAPRRIWAWGSLLHEDSFDENSDIDIAVEGLISAAAFFDLHRRAEDLTPFPLDLIEMENTAEVHRRHIIMHGTLLYDLASKHHDSR